MKTKNARNRLGFKQSYSDNPEQNPLTPNFGNPVKNGKLICLDHFYIALKKIEL